MKSNTIDYNTTIDLEACGIALIYICISVLSCNHGRLLCVLVYATPLCCVITAATAAAACDDRCCVHFDHSEFGTRISIELPTGIVSFSTFFFDFFINLPKCCIRKWRNSCFCNLGFPSFSVARPHHTWPTYRSRILEKSVDDEQLHFTLGVFAFTLPHATSWH